jgi:hypothetical protein
MCLVFQLEDGRVTEGWEYFRDLYAWDEFWSYPGRQGGDGRNKG